MFGREQVAFENVAEQQVVVHRTSDDIGHLLRLKLDEGIVLGGTGLLVAGQFEVKDAAELAEVRLHLGLEEASWNAAA